MSDAEKSNVVPFRPFLRGRAHPFEVVEIFPITDQGERRLLLSVAGPWTASPHEGGERKPWQWMATYSLSQTPALVGRAETLAAQMGIEIMDFAGVTATPHPCARLDDGGAAA